MLIGWWHSKGRRTELPKGRRSCRSWTEKRIRRAQDGVAAAIQHVCVDHGRFQIPVSEKLLNRPNIVTLGEEVGGERIEILRFAQDDKG